MPIFDQISIYGPGLLGASIAMAIREREISKKIKIWARRAETLEICREKPWCDYVTDDTHSGYRGSELIVLCTPVENIITLIEQILPKTESGVLITDVGSVKNDICASADCFQNLQCGDFVGAHPMAGSDKSGLNHASSNLFDDRTCFVTPLKHTQTSSVDKVTNFWTSLGMSIQLESPEKHDWIVAQTSHLPHFISSSLARYLESTNLECSSLGGAGLRDSTRIAGGDPELWAQIMRSNQENLVEALKLWLKSTEEALGFLNDGKWEELKAFLEEGAIFRKNL